MSRHAFNSGHMRPASKMYSHGSSAAGIVTTAGIVAIDGEGRTQHVGDAAGQTRHVLTTISAILAARGCTLDDAVSVQVFLKDMRDYAAMNAAYAEFFPVNPPPRYCVTAGLVKDDWLVEIALTAASPSSS